MKAPDREAVRARALELLRATRVVLPNRPRASLDDLVLIARSYDEQRAETAAFIAIAQAFVTHGLSWTEFFTPVEEIGIELLRAIINDAIDLIRRA